MDSYYLNAIGSHNEKVEHLFTYDCFHTIEKAKEQIEIWEKHYHYKIYFWYITKNESKEIIEYEDLS